MVQYAKRDNAKRLYLDGIRDGNAREAVTKYTGDRYTQHSTGVADGVEGFVAFFEPFIERCPVRDIRILRAIEDGAYVFLHAFQDINNGEAQWITGDIFDTDSNDKIVEHWDVIQAYEDSPASRHTMIDGATDVTDIDKTEDNKTLVRRLFSAVLFGEDATDLASFIREEGFIEHNPLDDDGLIEQARQGNKYRELHRLVGEGNFVATLSRTQVSGDDWASIDVFRIADARVVEHWTVQEKILPKEQWGNSGKF